MRNTQLLGIFAVAAVAAIASATYFTSGNLQLASVANLLKPNVGKSTVSAPDTRTVGGMTPAKWQLLCEDGRPHIQVVSPNGGETYQFGQNVTIEWRSCHTTTPMTISLDSSAGPVYWYNVPNTGTFTTTIPSTTLRGTPLPAGKIYKVTVLKPRTAIKDSSDDTFTINESKDSWLSTCKDGKPHIQVISPNGNEIYISDQQIITKWKTCNVPTGALINGSIVEDSSTGGTTDLRIKFANASPRGINITENDGNEIFTIPAGINGPIIGGQRYKMFLALDASNPLVYDKSDNNFTLNNREGLIVSNFNSNYVTAVDTNGHTTKATFTVSFKVTANGDDYYISKNIGRGLTPTQAGLVYSIEDGSGATTNTAGGTASSLTSSSGANTVGNYFEVANGETETFSATIFVTKGTDGADFYRVQLNGVGYDTDQVGTLSWYPLTPANNYETASVRLD